MNSKSLFLLLIVCLLGGIFPLKVIADTVSNANYSIDVKDIDTNPQPTIKPQVLGTQNQQSEFTTGPNYTIRSSNDTFSIKLSQGIVDYGILSSTNPIIRTSEISLTTPLHGSQIISYEDHPLLSSLNDSLQNTSCDNGSCTSETAAVWNNALTYGFGYRCDSKQITVCDSQFSSPNYFKQFSDNAKSQSPEQLLFDNESASNLKATVTYKVNISGTQKVEGYYNSISFLEIPNF